MEEGELDSDDFKSILPATITRLDRYDEEAYEEYMEVEMSMHPGGD